MMSIYERIIQEAADAIIVAQEDGTIQLWNLAAEQMFGFSAQEAVGRSLDLIVPEKLRERHWAGFHETMKTGHTKYGTQVLRVPAIKRDGSRFSIAFTTGLLRRADGKIEGIFAILRDDTEPFNTQKALRERIKELEQALEAAKAK